MIPERIYGQCSSILVCINGSQRSSTHLLDFLPLARLDSRPPRVRPDSKLWLRELRNLDHSVTSRSRQAGQSQNASELCTEWAIIVERDARSTTECEHGRRVGPKRDSCPLIITIERVSLPNGWLVSINLFLPIKVTRIQKYLGEQGLNPYRAKESNHQQCQPTTEYPV